MVQRPKTLKSERRLSERRIVWSKDASYQDINPKLKPVPSPPPPGSLPPPSKIPDTKNDVGGGRGERGQEEPFTDNDHSDPGANRWELAPRRVFCEINFLQLQTKFRGRQKSEQQAFGDVRIQALGTNLWKLDNSITEAKHLFYKRI